jgi:transposase
MLSEAQMRRIEPYFPLSHGIPRVDDRRIVSGIIFVIRNGLRWRDAPAGYRQRHKVENMFGKLKDWRRIHTRYDRCAHTFMSAICIAATVIFWLPQ